MNIILDEGYSFSLGCFETIYVINNKSIFLEKHLNRLSEALFFLKLNIPISDIKYKIDKYLSENVLNNHALKVIVSEKNIIISSRENLYKKKDYLKGFSTDISTVLRNQTSPFTYHKTLMYGENILEKRNFNLNGIDEPIFKNFKGEICEGATSNVFFIKKDKIYTPSICCGLLKGIIRSYICENYNVEEKIIQEEDVYTFDEMFLTNSLLGIMPVNRFKNHVFKIMEKSFQIHKDYEKNISD